MRVSIEFEDVKDQVDNYELIDEITHRVSYGKIKPEDLEDLIAEVRLKKCLDVEPEFSVKTLDDQMKVEHLNKVFDKYTSHQLEQLIPEI